MKHPPKFIASVMAGWNNFNLTIDEVASLHGLTRNAVIGMAHRHDGKSRKHLHPAHIYSERRFLRNTLLISEERARVEALLHPPPPRPYVELVRSSSTRCASPGCRNTRQPGRDICQVHIAARMVPRQEVTG